jgi:tetratricopeptide (TPR) repeat protein
LQDADDGWRADTRQRIGKLSQKFEHDIAESPNDPITYNQLAWLIANTEGDYEKAVRYSRRSLELLGAANDYLETAARRASFLDTLGRCYYAVGDYEQAVKNQREAVQLIPHMQVMQRQLKLFEAALAKKGAGSNHDDTKSTKLNDQ